MFNRLFQAIKRFFIKRNTPTVQEPLPVKGPSTPEVPSETVTPFSIAKKEKGVTEIRGSKHNPRIIEYHATTGGFSSDEVAWCSSFMNWCHKEAGAERSEDATARSWLRVGKVVTKPQIGDIVILWSGSKSGWRGHVGFYAGEKGSKILMFGGNQSNTVNYQYFPKSRLLGYRRV